MRRTSNPSSHQRPASFDRWVRQGLRQLFDSPSLGTHPLADLLLDPDDALDRGQSLRQILLDAIQSARPAPSVPLHSGDWRAYRILEMRFLEGLTPAEAMDQLALQKSQFYRDQAQALRAIADHLWDIHRLRMRQMPRSAKTSHVARMETLKSETMRLCAEGGQQQIGVNDLLDELRPVLESLVEGCGVQLSLSPGEPVCIGRASRVLLRQAVLSAATWAVEDASNGGMEISTIADEQKKGVRICVMRLGPPGPVSHAASSEQQGPPICQQVMSAMGGSSHARESAGCREVHLTWPAGQTRTILVIDDNQGFVDLVCRYLSGHAWQVVGASNGTTARETITRIRPTVIMLDVMMPHEDGWELLMALKGDGQAVDVPVIICSVLGQPALATALGAAAYLPKPISEESLLGALAPWSHPNASPASGSPD